MTGAFFLSLFFKLKLVTFIMEGVVGLLSCELRTSDILVSHSWVGRRTFFSIFDKSLT